MSTPPCNSVNPARAWRAAIAIALWSLLFTQSTLALAAEVLGHAHRHGAGELVADHDHWHDGVGRHAHQSSHDDLIVVSDPLHDDDEHRLVADATVLPEPIRLVPTHALRASVHFGQMRWRSHMPDREHPPPRTR